MATLLDYASLSAMVYNDVRGTENKISPDPIAGWSEVLYSSNPGFTAGAYQNGNVKNQRGQLRNNFSNGRY